MTMWEDHRQETMTGASSWWYSILRQLKLLPQGWEMARTDEGQMYFVNQETNMTTWAMPFGLSGLRNWGTLNPHLSDQPLPVGWETNLTPDGSQVYFINHISKTTTWDDPRGGARKHFFLGLLRHNAVLELGGPYYSLLWRFRFYGLCFIRQEQLMQLQRLQHQ